MLDNPTIPTPSTSPTPPTPSTPPPPAPSDLEDRRIATILNAATAGGSLLEIAAAVEITEHQLVRHYGRYVKKAWARRTIALRSALTRAALDGNVQALKRLNDLEWKTINMQRRKETEYGND